MDVTAPAGRYRVAIRRDLDRRVKPEAEQLDGEVFLFKPGWLMDDHDPYPGETAMLPFDPLYPRSAPLWIASGDLEIATDDT